MCTQSTKDMLERMVNSSDLHGLCPAGTPKTTPLVLEVSSALAEPSLSPGCSRQHVRRAAANPSCPPFSKRRNRDSLHSINPAFRLASPSPSLSRSTLVLGDPPDTGFIALH
uniref:Zinc finger, DHHC-type containing 18a n=1 Tax=Nothobranchius kuhntae TaxID=321403 RepID=A0A1A8K2D8_NOTKU